MSANAITSRISVWRHKAEATLEHMSRLHRLRDVLSGTSWILGYLAFTVELYVIFSPTLFEYAVVFFADCLLLPIYLPTEKYFFLKRFSEFEIFFGDLKDNEFAKMSLGERLTFFRNACIFPKLRAKWAFFASYVKVIPGILIIVFFFEHPDRSNLEQFLLILSVASANMAQFYGSVFSEAHRFLSERIADLHRKQNWAAVFEMAEDKFSYDDFMVNDRVIIAWLFFFVLLLQTAVIYDLSSQGASTNELIIKTMIITLVGLCLFARLIYLSNSYLVNGIKDIFQNMDYSSFRDNNFSLPYHTTTLLSSFERSFNRLLFKLRKSEEELKELVKDYAEQARFRAVGEMSSLIAHDLSGPLHTILFCAQQIKEEPNLVLDPRYSEQLLLNANEAVELTQSLRARLKNQKNTADHSNFLDAHLHVLRLLRTQFRGDQFDAINFECGDKAAFLQLKISRVDLIHILDNVYRNCITNLLENSVFNPRIGIDFQEVKGSFAEVEIRDNGTGIGSSYRENDSDNSLGLKLIRRLTELHEGSLTVGPNYPKGTKYKLILKLALPVVTAFRPSGASETQFITH